MVLGQPSVNLDESSEDNGFMFSPSLLSQSAIGEVMEGLKVRPLHIDDFKKGFLDCLSQLTTVGEISQCAWEYRFYTMKNTNPQSYFVVVLEEMSTGRIVGAVTLVLEWKFIHSSGCRGRVEDLVIDKEMRGKKLGAILNRVVLEMAKQFGVYKVSLECKDHLIAFYELFGYKKDQGNNFLVQRFNYDIQIPTIKPEQCTI